MQRILSAPGPVARPFGRTIALLLAGSLGLFSCGGDSPKDEPKSDEPGKERPAEPEGRPLFDGKTLSGWHVDIPAADGGVSVPESFVARDGLLVSLGEPQGHLITDEVHKDYRLELEWRWPGEAGNCGVLVHSSTPRRLYGMFPQSIEVQLHRDNAGDFWCIGEDITVADMEARRGDPAKWGVEEGRKRRVLNLTDGSEKPLGEWNSMAIECRGDTIKVWVNGDMVNYGTGCTASEGQIAIQAEGAEAEFRGLTLTSL